VDLFFGQIKGFNAKKKRDKRRKSAVISPFSKQNPQRTFTNIRSAFFGNMADDNPRAHRKGIPTFSGRGEIEVESRVMDRMSVQLAASAKEEKHAQAAAPLADVAGYPFDMGGAMAFLATAFSSGKGDEHGSDEMNVPTEEDKGEITRWAEAGWPKRVVYAIASAWRERTDDARRMLALESDTPVLVGPDMMPNWTQTVEAMNDRTMPDAKRSEHEVEENIEVGEFGLPGEFGPALPGSRKWTTRCAHPDGVDTWEDCEFFIDNIKSVRHNRLVVLQRGPCTTPDACKKAACPRASTALWQLIGSYREFGADRELEADLDPEEVDVKWKAMARHVFLSVPGLRACDNRVAIRVDTTRIAPPRGDQCGLYLSLPLPEACHNGDFELCLVSVDVRMGF
jgi:hypothetical protein